MPPSPVLNVPRGCKRYQEQPYAVIAARAVSLAARHDAARAGFAASFEAVCFHAPRV